MTVSKFKYIPRRNRAKVLIPKIKNCSARFKRALRSGDIIKQEKASQDAWNALSLLFETLRGEQDAGRLPAALMRVDTGLVAKDISEEDSNVMFANQKIDRSKSVPMDLRTTLNKIAHWEGTTFRVDGRNAHYLLLRGVFNRKIWFAEVLISKLCKSASSAIDGISG